MNKIFKVIYSKTRHCYVVVSELAKSHCKTAGSHTARNKTALTAAVLLALGAFSFAGMPVAQAGDSSAFNNDFMTANDTYWYWNSKNGWDTKAYTLTDWFNNRRRGDLPNYEGAGAKEPGAITGGLFAQAGRQTVTIGNRNAGQSMGSVFIGEHSGYDVKTSNPPTGLGNNYVTSVGFQSDATGWGSIAIGSNATAENTKVYGTAANMTEDKDNNIYEIEKNPTIEGASVALGYGAHSKDGNIAIGSYSDATAETTKNKTAYTDEDAATSYVSVGNSKTQRRITNVADGADATDVATVGQLRKAIAKTGTSNWSLTTNKETNKSTVINPDTTVDFSATVDGKNGTEDHKNVSISHDGSNVTIGLNKDIVLGESSAGKGGSLNIYSDSSDANNQSNHVSINGSTISVNYTNKAGSDARGVILGVGEDDKSGADGYIAFNNAAGGYTYLHSATDAPENLQDRLEYVGNDRKKKYIANLDDISNLSNTYAKTDLSNITTDGTKVIKKAAVGAVKVAAGDRVTVTKNPEDTTDADTVTYTISAKNDGKVESGNTNLVSGGTVYSALQDQAKSLTYKGGWGINIDSSNKISLKNDLTTIIKNGNRSSQLVKFNIDETAMAIGAIFNNSGSSGGSYAPGHTMIINSTGYYSVRLGGINNSTEGDYSTVTGGSANVASGYASAVNGGKNNTASGRYATVIGGGYLWANNSEGDFPDVDESIFGSAASDYRNDASGDLSIIVGGSGNRTSGQNSLIAGGIANKASNESASVFGGGGNTAAGVRTTVSGGNENLAGGTYSNIFGGIANTAEGNYSTISGGYENIIASQGPIEPNTPNYNSQSSGDYGSAFGGGYNMVGGKGGTAVGGGHSVVYGWRSVGLAGGSTGLGAHYALAAGYQSVVTSKGSKLVTSDKRKEFTDDYYYDSDGHAYKISGKGINSPQMDFIPEYEDVATAVGYQATANEPNTISFGHDVGDVSGYTVKWKERTDTDKWGNVNTNSDGTINDYTKTPDIVTNHYDTAKYNRLVKVADGINNHDAVVMEQLRNADNVGKNAKNNVVVYKKNADGSLQVDEYGEAIIDVDASKAETEKDTAQAVKDSENAWGAALGTGSIAADNGQLVTGKTVYTYDAPVAEKSKTLKYVSADNTTGQNLASLDAHVAANADKIDELDKTKTHFYSVNSKDTNAGNYNNDGATGQNALAAGVGAVAKGESSVAIGTNSTATGTQAIAIGEKAKAGNQGIAVGANASAGYGQNMALGYYANVEGGVNNSTALGYGSKVTKSDILKRDGNNGVVSVGRSVGQSGEPGITRRIINVRAGFNDTDAVNVSQLKSAQTDLTNTGLTFAANSGADYTAKLGSKVTIQGTKKKDGHEYTADNLTTEIDDSGNITIKMDKNISAEKIAVNGKDGKNGQPGTAGSIGINGQDGQSGIGIDGKDGISIKGKDGQDGVTIKVDNGKEGKDGSEGHIGLTGRDGSSADIIVKKGYDDTDKGINGTNGVDGKDGITRIVYKDETGEHQIATMEDGLKFKGDDDTVISKKLNNTLEIIGGAKGDLTEGNIGVKSTKDHQLKVQLAKDLTSITSISNQTTTKVDGKDVTTGAKITLGDDGSVDVNGGKITNVGSGADASGKYTTTTNAANIGDVQKIVKDAVDSASDTTNKALAGKANINASNIGANLKDASQEEKKDNAKLWGNAIGTGEIKDDDGRMVTGKTVYDEVRPENDGSYVKKDKTTGENLSALDTKIGKLDEDGNYIKKDDSVSKNLSTLDAQVKNNADAIAQINTSISTLDQNAVKYDDSSKSKVTLGGGEGGTTITNVKDGALSDSSKEAVNGKQLFNEQQAREAADKAITEKVTNNTNKITKIENGEGFTDAGTTVIKNLAKGAVQVKAGTAITVADNVDDKGNKTYTISANNDGKVEKNDGNLISGDTLYNEVRPTEDGSYVKKDKTTHENLSALDSGLKATSDLIHTNDKGDTIQIGGSSTATKIDVSGKDANGNTTGRVITGVISDASDPNSAANVGYVNGVTAANTQQIYRDMNNAYGRLDRNINRAAAGSNALAALHPLDFDPADKASFAVGYGHYHNANAAAVGAFYQPNANTMVNMGISLGNGDPGFNAGVSFKIGKGSTYNGVSKAEMAQTIHDQAAEISTIKANDAAKDKRIDALEKENQEMKKQIQEILARLNG